jgi:alkylation response protein AidB-like acyl-CoA dehydrogenase
VEIKVEALNATELRVFAGRTAGEAMGAASSMLKLSARRPAGDHRADPGGGGIYAQPFVEDTWAEERTNCGAGPDYAAPAAPAYFNYRKTSIYAGSNEIQHNIMAKMVLGL